MAYMKRNIIQIDEEKCDGCGLCVNACHEGALALVDGKAKILRDDYCDGLGNCLPVCPTGAITLEEREATPYNEEEVKKNMQQEELACGCPGTHVKTIEREAPAQHEEAVTHPATHQHIASQLNQWPIQIKLVPPNAPYFKNANLLIAADCAAYAYGNFHNDYMRNKITLIGCPKLDDCDYSDKLTAILKNNDIKSIVVARMEVPCCMGIENDLKKALLGSGKLIPWQVVVIGTDGSIIED